MIFDCFRKKREKNFICFTDTGDADELFSSLEDAIKKYSTICVKNNEKRKIIQSCIDAFVNKYSYIIENVSLNEKNYETTIKLKFREKDRTGHYIDLQEEYDENYYLNDCGGYHEFIETNGKRLDPRLMNMMYLIEPKEGDRILDVGCGRGELTYALAKRAEVIGVDYSEAAIKIAEDNFSGTKEMLQGRLKYICGDVVELKQQNKFDKIVLADVYEHIEAEVMKKLLGAIAEMLTDDGMLFIHTAPNVDYYETVYAKRVDEARKQGLFLPKNPRSRYEDRMHINEQSTRSLKKTLSNYFPEVYVWSGNVENEDQLRDVEKQGISNEITAVAGKHLSLEDVFKRSTQQKLDKDSIDVVLECEVKLTEIGVGNQVEIPITIKNLGSTILKSQQPYPVYLAYHILDKSGTVVLFDGKRTILSEVIMPDECVVEKLSVTTENIDVGEYFLIVDLVQEGVFWFADVCENSSVKIGLRVC